MMEREQKKIFLLNQLPANTDCYYVDGFIDGFDCTYDAVSKDFKEKINNAIIEAEDSGWMTYEDKQTCLEILYSLKGK